MVNRLHKICSDKFLFDIEVENLKSVFRMNSYPENVIRNEFFSSLKRLKAQKSPKVKRKSIYYGTIHTGISSDIYLKQVKSITKPGSIELVTYTKSGQNLLQKFSNRLKPKI